MVHAGGFQTWQNNTNPSWWKDPGLRKNVAAILLLYNAVFTFGYDGSLLNGLQGLPEWQEYFGHPKGNALGIISASYYLSSIPTAFVAAYCNERFGRKFGILVGSIISVAGGLITTFANGRGMYIGGRAVLGVGTPFLGVAGPSMILELAAPRLRAIAAGLFLCWYYIGALFSSWLCYGMTTGSVAGEWAFRLPTIFQITGPLIMLGGYYWLPESPRWLMSQGREAEAIIIYQNHHANGTSIDDDELVRNEVAEIRESIDIARRTPMKGYMDFTKTPGNRRRLLIILTVAAGSQLNGVSIISYYLAPILALIGITLPKQIALINGGLSLWNLFWATAAALQVERFGRRTLWLIGTAGMLGSFAVVTGLSGAFASSPAPALGTTVIVFLFIFFGFYDISFTCLPNLYLPEVNPFDLRSKALALYSVTGSVSLAFNQYINPVALEAIAWKYYFVYIGVQIVLFVIVLLWFPETKGRTPEEIIVLFDKDMAVLPNNTSELAEVEDEKTGKDGKDDIEHLERS